MNKLTTIAGAAAFLAASSLAALAAEATGTIVSVDPMAGTIMLDDGNTYVLPPEIDIAALAAGSQVTVTYEDIGGELSVTAIYSAS